MLLLKCRLPNFSWEFCTCYVIERDCVCVCVCAAHPLLFVPRWFGLLFLPVLTLLIPYLVYLVSLQDNNLQSAG
jgi:hypothetical protein